MGEPTPSSLRELSLGLIAGTGLRNVLSETCAAVPLQPASWRQSIADTTPHLLLAESSGLREQPQWQHSLPDLLGRCAELEIPSVLWITDLELNDSVLTHAPSFDRVFTTELGHLGALREVNAVAPGLLSHACQALSTDSGSSRPVQVGWIGGWSEGWPRGWGRMVEALLDAAADRGLRIFAEEPGLEGRLPQRLRGLVEHEPDAHNHAASRSRVLLGADPHRPSPTATPPLVFDAIERGAAVISPDVWGVRNAFRDLVPVARDRDRASKQLDRLLGDEALRADLVQRARRVIRYNHTYQHRVATIASAAGYRVLPDP